VPGRWAAADTADGAVQRAARIASSEAIAGRLRHTFCSHLAMRGAPPRAIQELAGHRELGMTQRYMHLSPAALDSAIRLLDQPGPPEGGHYVRGVLRKFGDLVETGRVSEEKING
jgi:integrase